MYVDEAEAVVGLIQGDVMGLVVDLVCNTEIGFIVEHDGRGGRCCGSGRSPDPLFDMLLGSDLVEEVLGSLEHDERSGSTDVCTVEELARD